VEVEAACFAVVHEPTYVLLACVAVTRYVTRRFGHELEGAFAVERVEQSGGGYHGTVHVKVEVTDGAFVTRPYAYFLAAITFEREF